MSEKPALIIPDEPQTYGEARIARLPAQHPAPAVVAQSETASLLGVIERAARDPSVDLDKLERLFAMRKELETETARKAFNDAMAACQKEMPAVAKNASNTHTKSRYATLDKVAEAIAPIYTKHGFFLSFDEGECPNEGMMRIKCVVGHKDGFDREYSVDVPIDKAGARGNDNKTATHAFGSTMTYGRRYLTLAIFNIATKEATPDNDGNAVDPGLSAEQVDEIEKLVTNCGLNRQKVLEYLRVPEFAEVSSRKFEEVKAVINRMKGTQANG